MSCQTVYKRNQKLDTRIRILAGQMRRLRPSMTRDECILKLRMMTPGQQGQVWVNYMNAKRKQEKAKQLASPDCNWVRARTRHANGSYN